MHEVRQIHHAKCSLHHGQVPATHYFIAISHTICMGRPCGSPKESGSGGKDEEERSAATQVPGGEEALGKSPWSSLRPTFHSIIFLSFISSPFFPHLKHFYWTRRLWRAEDGPHVIDIVFIQPKQWPLMTPLGSISGVVRHISIALDN